MQLKPRLKINLFQALGTTAYKAKDFETAVTHYQKAYEIYVKDISPLTNIAACKFEQDDFDGCIETCLDAIEKGREVMCDYTLIGKAFVRIGNTHMRRAARAEGFEAKEPFYNEAIEAYAKSLLEHYTNDGTCCCGFLPSLTRLWLLQLSIGRRKQRLC